MTVILVLIKKHGKFEKEDLSFFPLQYPTCTFLPWNALKGQYQKIRHKRLVIFPVCVVLICKLSSLVMSKKQITYNSLFKMLTE